MNHSRRLVICSITGGAAAVTSTSPSATVPAQPKDVHPGAILAGRTGKDDLMRSGHSAPPAWHPLAWADALTQFGQTEMAGGLVLVGALLAALVWANADPHSYFSAWAHTVTSHTEPVPPALHTVANEIDNGLMTIFFLAIGLEIGREVADGSLRDARNALLPAVAALGGMAGAALVYLITVAVLHPVGGVARGWGIPMATDVAFTLGAIALLGARVPRPLRTFVLALAIADDVASVVVLAVVASTRLQLWWLVGGVIALGAVALLRRTVRQAWWPYVVAAIVVWYLFVRGGIEPSLAGAFVGLLVPVAGGARAGRRLEGPVHALSSYVVLPLFVLANGGVLLTGALWHHSAATSVVTATFTARTVGKMLGITLAVLVMVRLGVCNLPERTSWRQMIGIALLCGMGLTVPLLFAHAVFGHSTLFAGAQVGLLLGTLGAALLGATVLFSAGRTGGRTAGRGLRTPAECLARATVPAAPGALLTPPEDHDVKEG
jgi:NhaA family Na+:H+ antiporter